MARYGYDYNLPRPDRGGQGPYQRDFGYGFSGYGRYDVEFGGARGGFGGRGGWGGSDAGRGYGGGYAGRGDWSAPEYGVYLGSDYSDRGGYRGMQDGAGYETGWAGYGGYDSGLGGDDRGGWEMGGGWQSGGWQGGGGVWGDSGADSVRAGDIMTENPEAVTPDTSLAEVAQRMRDLNVGIIPVVEDLDGSRLRGVITDRDIAVRAAAEGKDMKKTSVSDIMTTNVETVGENDHVRDVFDVMKREQVRRVPVTDREGRLVGIIAQADLAIDYAGLNLQRETEVEEVIERISEPGRPEWGRARRQERVGRRYVVGGPREYDRDFTDRIRHGWQTLRREARDLIGGGYDRGWR